MRLRRAYGFTLLEQAVSLSVIALVLGSVMMPLKTQIENRKIDETRRMLEHAQEMLLAYALAHGHFPCPSTATSNGQEPAGADHASGACPEWYGFLPATLLGFRPTDASGYALDAWEAAANRIRYAVAPFAIAGVSQPLTRMNGMRSVPLASLASTPLFHICQSGSGPTEYDCGGAVTLSSNAAIVVWSVGANAANGGTSVHEAQNPNPNGGSADRVFVSREPSTAEGHEFDDLVAWIPVTTLIARLVAAGQFTPPLAVAAARAP
jgi:type II secretory pathway pseudopilin PulG